MNHRLRNAQLWHMFSRDLTVLPAQHKFSVSTSYIYTNSNWRAQWKNRICSTTMKLRKSLVKPVTRQKTRVIFSGGTTKQHVIIIITCLVVPPEKITHKASDVTENLQLWRVVRLFHPRSSTTMHISADVQRITFGELAAVD